MSKSAPLSLSTSHFLIILGLYCVSTIFRLDYGYLRSRVRERKIKWQKFKNQSWSWREEWGDFMISSNWVQFKNAYNRVQTVSASNWVKSMNASNWVQSTECNQWEHLIKCNQWVQSVSAFNWGQSVSASNWVKSISTSNIQLVAIMDKSDKCGEHFPSTIILCCWFTSTVFHW